MKVPRNFQALLRGHCGDGPPGDALLAAWLAVAERRGPSSRILSKKQFAGLSRVQGLLQSVVSYSMLAFTLDVQASWCHGQAMLIDLLMYEEPMEVSRWSHAVDQSRLAWRGCEDTPVGFGVDLWKQLFGRRMVVNTCCSTAVAFPRLAKYRSRVFSFKSSFLASRCRRIFNMHGHGPKLHVVGL